jgi:urea carboxylase
MWNTWRDTQDFPAGSPWLLRFFDQIHFHPVSAEELLRQRDGFLHGDCSVRVEETSFSLGGYNRFLADIAEPAADFKRHQQAAFDAERERWLANGQADFAVSDNSAPVMAAVADVPPGCQPVRAPVTANVWSIAVEPGQRVAAGDRLLILEAMKMEVAVSAPSAGVVELLQCSVGGMVMGGQQLLQIRVDV